MLFIFLFSLSQLHLTWIYINRKVSVPNQKHQQNFLPRVTVQLPVYNEKYVIERLIKTISKLDYPKQLLEIQILDDSTDETTSLIVTTIDSLRPLDLDIKLIHRQTRTGFKAGALENGMKLCTAEFIAIFDADFIPDADFLKKCIPHFTDSNVGMVQTRWAHINKGYSLLTELQAFGLDAHFSVEQCARNVAGSFINFNGTCGVWRKKCIEDSGGWSADTLTEDLDLSYRAQLKGWRFLYKEDVATPGELPIIMPAIKSQQYRWNKGAAETARKHLANVLTTQSSFKKKFHAVFHLLNSSVFVCVFLAAILSVPILFLEKDSSANLIFRSGSIFFLGFLSITLFYWTATKRFYKNPFLTFIKLFPPFLIVSMGLSFHNCIAVLEGLAGRKTPFIRTPKFNIIDNRKGLANNTYITSRITIQTILEALLCLYFLTATLLAFYLQDFSLILFHSMLALGFGSVFYFSVKQ
jgi:cellulose synthase/poly-beta-1,6-N-acetylglucosamine synthase-like glycosyltransferase